MNIATAQQVYTGEVNKSETPKTSPTGLLGGLIMAH